MSNYQKNPKRELSAFYDEMGFSERVNCTAEENAASSQVLFPQVFTSTEMHTATNLSTNFIPFARAVLPMRKSKLISLAAISKTYTRLKNALFSSRYLRSFSLSRHLFPYHPSQAFSDEIAIKLKKCFPHHLNSAIVLCSSARNSPACAPSIWVW